MPLTNPYQTESYCLFLKVRRRNLNRDCYLEIHHIVPKGVYGTGIMDEGTLTDVEDEKNKSRLATSK